MRAFAEVIESEKSGFDDKRTGKRLSAMSFMTSMAIGGGSLSAFSR